MFFFLLSVEEHCGNVGVRQTIFFVLFFVFSCAANNLLFARRQRSLRLPAVANLAIFLFQHGKQHLLQGGIGRLLQAVRLNKVFSEMFQPACWGARGRAEVTYRY